MSNVKKFELGAVLSMTTGYNCVDDFDKVWELVFFVCNDNMMGPMGLGMFKDRIKEHILSIHPELANVKYNENRDINDFISEQEEKFGSFIAVTQLGVKLPQKYTVQSVSEGHARSLKPSTKNKK